MTVNIEKISRALRNSPPLRKIFRSAVYILLHALEASNLITQDKLEAMVLDWERGTLDLGDQFMEQLLGRSASRYIESTLNNKSMLESTGTKGKKKKNNFPKLRK